MVDTDNLINTAAAVAIAGMALNATSKMFPANKQSKKRKSKPIKW